MRATLSTICGLWLLLEAAVLPARADGATATAALKVEPTDIPITTFYESTTIHIEGRVPAGQQAAVVCSGQVRPVDLQEKGKVWGLLWMTVGDVTFEHVPVLYQVISSRELTELAPPAALTELGVGFDAVRAQNEALTGESRTYFDELLKLKQSEDLFSQRLDEMALSGAADGEREFKAECYFPAKAPPGEYSVTLYGFKAGQAQQLGSTKLTIHREGFTQFIVSLAEQHGLLYGILAVMIALAVGLLTGLVFGLGSKGGH